MHNRCKQKLDAAKRPRCPSCKGSWDTENDGIELSPIGEASVAPEEDNQVGSTRRKKRSTMASEVNGVDESDEDEAEEEFEEEDGFMDVTAEASRPERSTRAQPTVNEVPETQVNGEDDDEEEADSD